MKQIQLTNKALYQISMRLDCTVSVTGSRRQLAAQLWLCNLVINIKDLINVLMQIRTVPDVFCLFSLRLCCFLPYKHRRAGEQPGLLRLLVQRQSRVLGMRMGVAVALHSNTTSVHTDYFFDFFRFSYLDFRELWTRASNKLEQNF